MEVTVLILILLGTVGVRSSPIPANRPFEEILKFPDNPQRYTEDALRNELPDASLLKNAVSVNKEVNGNDNGKYDARDRDRRIDIKLDDLEYEEYEAASQETRKLNNNNKTADMKNVKDETEGEKETGLRFEYKRFGGDYCPNGGVRIGSKCAPPN